ncbi:MAG TPA: hydantoinase B/oxoprolinase family protein, partial [Lacipirellulaceae bacterium]|nr:hydantoinase B/oxoprolinase family protein [Lacipirellulaceae bacterium]
MARAIHNVTVAQGRDPREYALAAFGGAAGQHACAVARELGIREILVGDDASLLSAYGIALAETARHAAQGLAIVDPGGSGDLLESIHNRLAAPLIAELIAEGIEPDRVVIHKTVDVRYLGTDASITIPFVDAQRVRAEFEAQHYRLFGYVRQHSIEVTAARVTVAGGREATTIPSPPGSGFATHGPAILASGGAERLRPRNGVYRRAELRCGEQISGPALIAEEHTTVAVDAGWTAEALPQGTLLLTDLGGSAPASAASASAPRAVQREIFNNLLSGVAERMGYVLRRTAISVNVKERLDYSCAVFTAAGELVASAAHIPVHLGAMGATVRAVLADNPAMQPGDAYATNDPYRGGSHLPDVTVVLPVFADEAHPQLRFFTACRAHHAELGGQRPGSMPPAAQRLGDEGVIISNFLLVRDGRLREQELRQLLASGPYPSRAIGENLADLHAQLAAVQHGADDLRQLAVRHGWPPVQRQVAEVQLAAEEKVRQALRQFPRG